MKKAIWYILVGILLIGCTTEQEQEFRDRYETEAKEFIKEVIHEELGNYTTNQTVLEEPEVIIPRIDIYKTTSLKSYPYVFLKGMGVFDAKLVVGKDAKAEVVIAAVDVITSLREYNITVGVYNLDTELELWQENMMLFGNPCNNRLIAEVMNLEYPTCGLNMDIPKYSGLLRIYYKMEMDWDRPKYAMIVVGYDYDDILMAAKYLAENTYNLKGHEAKLYQSLKTEVIVK